jgi:hypothetical protein
MSYPSRRVVTMEFFQANTPENNDHVYLHIFFCPPWWQHFLASVLPQVLPCPVKDKYSVMAGWPISFSPNANPGVKIASIGSCTTTAPYIFELIQKIYKVYNAIKM